MTEQEWNRLSAEEQVEALAHNDDDGPCDNCPYILHCVESDDPCMMEEVQLGNL